MKVSTMAERPWLVHALAYCSDCGWDENNWRNAVKEGRKHASKTGHMVTVETGYAQIYNPK